MKPYRIAELLAFVLCGGLISGCTYEMPASVSSTSVGNAGEVPVKVVSGKSDASYFLFFGPFGDDSLKAALEDARRQGDGDTLANVFVDRKLFCVPSCGFAIYTSVQTQVTGTLVKYTDERSVRFRQPVPLPVAQIQTTSPLNVSGETAYSQMIAAYSHDQSSAESLHRQFSSKTRDDLRSFVINQRGNGSAWNWKLSIPPNTSDDERRFLVWYVKTYTDYKPVQ